MVRWLVAGSNYSITKFRRLKYKGGGKFSASRGPQGLKPVSFFYLLRGAKEPLFHFPYAALPGPLASIDFSLPTFTLICFGLASAFLGNVIFRTPLS